MEPGRPPPPISVVKILIDGTWDVTEILNESAEMGIAFHSFPQTNHWLLNCEDFVRTVGKGRVAVADRSEFRAYWA